MPGTESTIDFSADRVQIEPGQCATLHWRVQSVKAVYLHAEGERWQDHGVVGEGKRQACPAQTTTYCLRVIKPDDSVEVHKLPIQVQTQAELPTQQEFGVDRTRIQPGECVTFRWHVEGVKAVYFHGQRQRWQDHGVVGVGEQQRCPKQTTTFYLRVVKRDDSVEMHKLTVEVQAQPVTPFVRQFSVDRAKIQPGECATFHWHVEGVKAVYFYAEGQRWQDHGTVGKGQQQVCPTQTTAYHLRVVNRDDSVDDSQLSVEVQAPDEPRIIHQFAADRTEIKWGECTTFHWRVEGVKAVYFYAEGQRWQDHGVAGGGQQEVCPAQRTVYNLRVVKRDDSVEIRQLPIDVRP
jgi:hypothetical protein